MFLNCSSESTLVVSCVNDIDDTILVNKYVAPINSFHALNAFKIQWLGYWKRFRCGKKKKKNNSFKFVVSDDVSCTSKMTLTIE